MVEQSLAQKTDKVEVNIKTCHITYNISYDFNLESHNTSRVHVEYSLKIIILQKLIK